MLSRDICCFYNTVRFAPNIPSSRFRALTLTCFSHFVTIPRFVRRRQVKLGRWVHQDMVQPSVDNVTLQCRWYDGETVYLISRHQAVSQEDNNDPLVLSRHFLAPIPNMQYWPHRWKCSDTYHRRLDLCPSDALIQVSTILTVNILINHTTHPVSRMGGSRQFAMRMRRSVSMTMSLWHAKRPKNWYSLGSVRAWSPGHCCHLR